MSKFRERPYKEYFYLFYFYLYLFILFYSIFIEEYIFMHTYVYAAQMWTNKKTAILFLIKKSTTL